MPYLQGRVNNMSPLPIVRYYLCDVMGLLLLVFARIRSFKSGLVLVRVG